MMAAYARIILIIARAIAEVQSATSLRLMLRDPLAFVWRYALGWRSLVEDEQPLSLDARAFGELVHEMLKRAVDALEPDPGYARAARHEIETRSRCGVRRHRGAMAARAFDAAVAACGGTRSRRRAISRLRR